MHRTTHSQNIESNKTKDKAQPSHKAYWALLLLLPLGLMLPLIGELLQILLIGEERVCCMPNNLSQLLAHAETAKSLRWLSNLIIGGSMLGGIALVTFAFAMLYRKFIPSLPKQYSRLALTIISIVCVYIICVLVTMLLFFVLHNDYYFEYRPWPGGSLYDGAWFNPLHWLKATFVNPFA